MSDYETGAGFEWRKTDAPNVVVSKFGSGIIYNGMLEGRINNLSTSSYYKVRPFYKASDGTMVNGLDLIQVISVISNQQYILTQE